MKPTTLDDSATETVPRQLLEKVLQTTEVRIKIKTTILCIINKLADRDFGKRDSFVFGDLAKLSY